MERRFTTGSLIRVLCPIVFAAFGTLFPNVAFFIKEANVVLAFWKAAFQIDAGLLRVASSKLSDFIS